MGECSKHTKSIGSEGEIVAVLCGFIRGRDHDAPAPIRPNILHTVTQLGGNSRVIYEKVECLFLPGKTEVRN